MYCTIIKPITTIHQVDSFFVFHTNHTLLQVDCRMPFDDDDDDDDSLTGSECG